MEEKTLLLLALAGSGIGLLALLAITTYFDEELASYSSITSLEGDEVSLVGEVVGVSTMGSVTKITVAREELVDIVIFDKAEVLKGSRVTVQGAVEEYNGKKEILANSIKIE